MLSLLSKIGGSLLKRPLLIALLVVVTWGGVQTARLRAERKARVRAEITLVNERASAALTQEYLVEGVRVFSLLAQQRALERDAIDAALDAETKVRVAAEARVAMLAGDTATATIEEAGVRLTELHAYDEPFTLDFKVRVPPPPARSEWEYRVALDAMPLNLRVSCVDSPDTDVSAALVAVDGPPWVSIDLKSVEQEVDVCNAEAEAILAESIWSRISIGPLLMASVSGYWMGGGMACYDGWCTYGGISKAGTDFGFSKTWMWSPFK